MMYKTLPKNFNAKFQVVGCYVEYEGKILLLRRSQDKTEGSRWGVPAGKVDNGEGREVAMMRELQEETGWSIPSSELKYLSTVYVKHPKYHFVFHMFQVRVGQLLEVQLNAREHTAYQWIFPKDALELDLVRDMERCIKMLYRSLL